MTATEHAPSYQYIGTRPVRHDGLEKVTGKARFAADLDLAGQLRGAMVRSPYAHARIVSIDPSAARNAPGVAAVITGAEMEKMTHPFPPFSMLQDLYTPLYWAMSSEKVRMVGDPVALADGNGSSIGQADDVAGGARSYARSPGDALQRTVTRGQGRPQRSDRRGHVPLARINHRPTEGGRGRPSDVATGASGLEP